MSADAKPPKPARLDRLQKALLRLIAEGGQRCREIEQQLGAFPPPSPETLVRVYQALILRSVLEFIEKPERITETRELMEMVTDWLRLLEKRQDRELEEKKHAARVERDRERKLRKPLTPGTLTSVENQLNLV